MIIVLYTEKSVTNCFFYMQTSTIPEVPQKIQLVVGGYRTRFEDRGSMRVMHPAPSGVRYILRTNGIVPDGLTPIPLSSFL